MNKEELKKQLEKCNRYLELKNSDNLVYDMLDIFGNNEIVYEYIQYANNLQQENKQLKDNWEEIKQFCLDEQIPEEYDEYNSYIEFSNSAYDNVYEKMEELEKGDRNDTIRKI